MPVVYVQPLGAYNAGKGGGKWVEVTGDPDELMEAIEKVLARSPVKGDEEWAFHDFDDFGGLSFDEHVDVETLSSIAALMEEHGEAIVAAVLGHTGMGYASYAEKLLTDGMIGVFKDMADFGWEQAHSIFDIPDGLETYVNYGEFAADMVRGGDVLAIDTDEGLLVLDNRI